MGGGLVQGPPKYATGACGYVHDKLAQYPFILLQ